VPIFLKVSPDIEDHDVKSICATVSRKECKVDGLIVCNTTVSRDGLIPEENVQSETGGLSGKPLRQKSTELVGKFYKSLPGSFLGEEMMGGFVNN